MGWNDWWNPEPAQQFYGPTNEELGYTPPAQPGYFDWMDQIPGTLSQLGGDIYSGITSTFSDPWNRAEEELRTDISGAADTAPYSLDRAGSIISALGKQAIGLPSDIVNTAFQKVMSPVEQAASYYSKQGLAEDYPNASEWLKSQSVQQPDPGYISQVGGGSMRDIAQGTYGVENPYLLETIEKGGGELLEELADPTNIPGALIGAAGYAGRAATNLDKVLAGMGVVSGFSGGLPALGEGIENVYAEGLTPESYGQLLEGTIGTGFGALSAGGLKAGGNIPAGSPNPILSALAPESTLGPEAGMAINPFAPPPIDPLAQIQESVQESSRNVLEQKLAGLQNLGYGENTIGGLGIEDVNNILSAQTPRADFNTDPISRMMQEYGISREFAEEMYAKEQGIESNPLTPEILSAPNPLEALDIPIQIAPGRRTDDMIFEALAGPEFAPEGMELNWETGQYEPKTEMAPEVRAIWEGEERRGIPRESEAISETLQPVESQAVPAGQQLDSFVQEAKNKYGDKAWRKELTEPEKSQFNTLQVAVQEAARKIPESLEKASPAYKEAYEKGELPEHYTEKLPKKEEIEKAKEDVKNKVKALGAAPIVDTGRIQPIQQLGPTETQPVQTISPPKSIPIGMQKKSLDEIIKEIKAQTPGPPESILPPKPPKQKKPPEPPKPEPREMKDITPFASAVRGEISNIERSNPEVGKQLRDLQKDREMMGSRWIYEKREATKGLSEEAGNRLVRNLRGENITLNPKEEIAAKKLRALMDEVAEIADKEDVLIKHEEREGTTEGKPTGYRKDYFPLEFDRIADGKVVRDFSKFAKDKPYGHLEKARTTKGHGVENLKTLEEYLTRSAYRIAEARHIGKGKSKVGELLGKPSTLNYYEKVLGRLTGEEKTSRGAKVADVWRHVTALGDLNLSVVKQLGQATHTVAEVGFRRTIRSLAKTLASPNREAALALKSSAIGEHIINEVRNAAGGKGLKFLRGYLHGIPTVDKAMRVWANVAGRMLFEDAAKGNKFAKRQLEHYKRKGVDISNIDEVAKFVSDKTQFRTGQGEMQIWATSPVGRFVMQYNNFAMGQARYQINLAKEFAIASKNPVKNWNDFRRSGGQILRYAAMGAFIAGEGVADLGQIVRALIPGKDDDDEYWRRALEAIQGDPKFEKKDFWQKLQATTRNKRIPIGNNPAWRIVQNLATIGGMGVLQSIAEKATSRDYWEALAGPALTDLIKYGEAGRKGAVEALGPFFSSGEFEDISRGDWTFKDLQKEMIRNAPIPGVSGYKIAEKVYPPKSRKVSYPKFPSF